MIPRQYQVEAVDSVFTYFETKSGNPLIAMPTGTGKSPVLAWIIRRALMQYPGTRILKLTHVKELISQNLEKLLKIWPTAPVGVYSAGLKRKEANFPITYAGIGSVSKKAKLFGHIDLVFIDEAHLVSPHEDTMYRKFFADLKEINPKVKFIGLSATCYRLGLGSLTEGGIFTDICFDITTREHFNRLVDEGYLAPLITKRTAVAYDLKNIRTHAGEYVQKDVQIAFDKDHLTYAAVQEIIEYGAERKCWLVFAAGLDHAIHVAAQFDSFGIPACVVHSDMSDEERDQNLLDYKDGKYRVIVNNNILTTGFDHPPVDLIAVLTTTKSTNKWVQMLGRGTRPWVIGGKINCLVLDFAGNTRRLGPINDPVIPTMKGKGDGLGMAPVKECPHCGFFIHASLRYCTQCGQEFPRFLKFRESAYSDEVMVKTELPIVEMFPVDKVIYSIHKKAGKLDVIKVTYYCGLRLFNEYICLEHVGIAGKRARDWWRQRTSINPPIFSEDAMLQIDQLKVPRVVHVWTNKSYPEIKNYDF